MIRVLRRSPVLWGVLGLATVCAGYVFVTKNASRLGRELWYRQVECRLVEDHASIVPPRGTRLWGMYRPELPWNFDRYYTIADSLGIDPGIVSWYQSWGDGPEHEFKSEAVEKAAAAGIVSMVTWEPWLSAFKHDAVLDPQGSMRLVANGKYDRYIRSWARAVVRARKPVLIRPFHELGNPWYGWGTMHENPPEVQIAAWRHVVEIFRAEGARNAAFVWTPFDAIDTLAWPGREWVDWIGLDIFNYGTMLEHNSWLDFRTLLAHSLGPVKRFGKPVIVAEVGTSGQGGDRKDWWRDAMLSLQNGAFPEVRAFVVFDNPACRNTTGIPMDWGFGQAREALTTMRPLMLGAGFLPARPAR